MTGALELLHEVVQAFGVPVYLHGADLAGLEIDDGGLRSRFFPHFNAGRLSRFFRGLKKAAMYVCEDMYGCRYCLFQVPDDEENARYCVIGPWLEGATEDAELNAIVRRGNIPAHLKPELAQYLEGVKQIQGGHSWEAMLFAHVSAMYKADASSRGVAIEIVRCQSSLDFPAEAYSPEPDAALSMKVIEERYLNETALLQAVCEGDAEKSLRRMALFRSHRGEQWTSNRLREGKNYLIVMDAILRRTVESCHVHPAHIDSISADFSRRIERVTEYSELRRLIEAMIRRYCSLVKKFSLKSYSALIRNVINTVDFNLQEPLSLSYLAEQFNVNPSNLSAQFRREKKMPLSEYIHVKRMQKAELLLRTSGAYIADIAEQCGFTDTNYFSRLFKRHFRVSPGEFRKMNA
jgi:AraC-like DNA-binding protein